MPVDRFKHSHPHRPPLHPYQNEDSSTSGSSSTLLLTSTTPKLYPLLSRLRIHVVTTKIEGPTIASLYSQIEALGGTVSRIEECHFAVTALQGRPRLVRLYGEERINEKQVLKIGFVEECYERCLKYGSGSVPHASLSNISSISLPPDLPKREDYLIPNTGPILAESEDEEEDTSEDLKPYPKNYKLEDIPQRAVLRCSPLVCVNQDIIEAIRPIYLMREFDDPDQKNSNVLSYKRSMSILKAVPRRLKSGEEALKLHDLGPKVSSRISEYLSTGSIQESQEILSSPRFKLLTLFSSIFTIGTSAAVDLYDNQGCRSLEDVAEYYLSKENSEWSEGVVGEGVPLGKSKWGGRKMEGQKNEKRRSRDGEKRRREGKMSKAEVVREWIVLKDEIDQKIPRAEVEEIGRCVKENLDALLPGCRYTLTGGYRRGKPESNDVDVVFTTPEEGQDEGLLKDLYMRLGALGIVTHVLQLTASSHQVPHHNNFDGLDKAFVLFRLPPKAGMKGRRLHRRVDLICAPRKRYALAVVGWSGSMMFERDLRRHAEKEHALKFDSGSLTHRVTGEMIFPKTERELFRILGLPYIRPELRNADG